MSTEQTKMQPWQVFQAARKYLGAHVVARIFGREKRSAYNWAHDPAHTVHRCKSPLELLHTLFERMDAVGLGYVVRAAITYLQTAIDQEETPGAIKETLPTIELELLADFQAVADLKQAIDIGTDPDAVRLQGCLANEEIERTVAKYIKDCPGDGSDAG